MLRDWPTDKTPARNRLHQFQKTWTNTLANPSDEKSNYALYPWGQCAFPSRGTEATSTEPAGNVIFGLLLGRVREQLLRPVHLN